MNAPKRPSTVVLARQMRSYKTGEKVKILRGPLAGQTMTIRESTNDWVKLTEMPKRDTMSKLLVEPAEGFTEQELIEARRVADKMPG